jgi:lysophospholipase L1-like esterase
MKIAFFGDSFIAGIGDPDGLGWAGRVCASAGAECLNFGVGGDTGEDVLARWEDEAAAAQPDALVFSFGANDCLIGEDRRIRVKEVDRLKNAKTVMAAAVRRLPTLFISPLPIASDPKANARIAEMARHLGLVARINRTPYVDIFRAVSESDVWRTEALAADGAHPGRSGYAAVADMVAGHAAWRQWVDGL